MPRFPDVRAAATTRTVAAAAAVAACGALAAPAAAASRVQHAVFDLTFSATQVTTWTYHVPDPEDPCATGIQADGDQTISARTLAPYELRASRSRRATGRPSRPRLQLAPARLQAHAERNGDIAELGHAPDECFPDSYGDGSGCDLECGPPPRDCGARTGFIDLSIGFRNRVEDDGLARLETPPRDQIQVRGQSAGWKGGELAPLVPGAPLGQTFENCEWWIGGPEAPAELDGGLTGALERLSERRLFRAKSRRIVVHGSAVKCYAAGGPAPCSPEPSPFAGKTIVAFKLTLLRRR